MEAFKTRLEALAAIAGVGVLIQFVGGAIMYFRFEEEEIPALQTVAILPQQVLFVAGARMLVPIAALGAIAALVLYGISSSSSPEETPVEPEDAPPDAPPPPVLVERWRAEERGASDAVTRTVRFSSPDPAEETTAPGELPAGFLPVVATFATLAAIIVVADDPTNWQWFLIAISAAVSFGVGFAIAWQTRTVSAAAWGVFVMALIFGSAVSLIRESDSRVRLDLGAVEREKDPDEPIGGYFIARTSDSVYLLTKPLDGGPGREIVVVKDADVKRLLYGPTGVEVNDAGFERGQRLAARLDHKPAKITVDAPAGQSLLRGRGIVVNVTCDERCRIYASAAVRGRRTGRQVLTPYKPTGVVAPGTPTPIRLSVPRGVLIRDATLRARVVVAARDLSQNKSQTSVRLTVGR